MLIGKQFKVEYTYMTYPEYNKGSDIEILDLPFRTEEKGKEMDLKSTVHKAAKKKLKKKHKNSFIFIQKLEEYDQVI